MNNILFRSWKHWKWYTYIIVHMNNEMIVRRSLARIMVFMYREGKIKSLVSYDFCKFTINITCVCKANSIYTLSVLRTLNCLWSGCVTVYKTYSRALYRAYGCKCKRLIRLCQFVSNQLWFARFFKGYVNFIFAIWGYRVLLNCLKA